MNSQAVLVHKTVTVGRYLTSKGVSLIELLVAVTIGAILIFGATQVYVDSRNTYEVNESMARLQETARYALSVVEPDIRMANYWGLLKGGGILDGQATPADGRVAIADGDPANACGTNFAVNVQLNIEASNAAYGLACGAFGPNAAMVTADRITIRRAATLISAADEGRLQICSNRVTGYLFSDGATSGCPGPPGSQINNLIVNSYYVSRDSTQQNGLPSLRRKALSEDSGAPAFFDEEIIPGVEDMQIQIGVDPTGVSGIAQRYVNPSSALPLTSQIVSVRIWLLVRAPTPEVGFIDDRVYVYGDRVDTTSVTSDLNNAAHSTRAFQPSASTDDSFTSVKRYRRLLVSRTIQLRNALGT